MAKFISRQKMSKKAKKELDSRQRATWSFSPVTKKVESRKLYNRKRKSTERYDDYGSGLLFLSYRGVQNAFPGAFCDVTLLQSNCSHLYFVDVNASSVRCEQFAGLCFGFIAGFALAQLPDILPRTPKKEGLLHSLSE